MARKKKHYVKNSSVSRSAKPNADTEPGRVLDRKTIGYFPKKTGEDVHIDLLNFKGHELVDVRVFCAYPNGDQYYPSKKGLSLPVGKIPQLIELLQKAKNVARQSGSED
jgi:hypothetical protein